MSTMDRDAGGGTVERPTPADEQAEHPQLTFERVIQPGAAVPVVDLAVAADGTWIAASFADAEYDTIVTIVVSPRGEVLTTLPGTPQAQLVASPSGRRLATFSPSSPLDVHVWPMPHGDDTGTRPATCVLPYAAWAASAVAWLPEADERTLYVGAAAGAVYRWGWDRERDQAPPEQLALRKLTTPGAAVTALVANPQGSWLAVGSADGALGTVTLDGSMHELSYPGRHASGVGGLYIARGWFLVSQAQGEPICRVWNPANTSPWVREWRLTDKHEGVPETRSRPSLAPSRFPFALDPQERWAYVAVSLARIRPWRYWRWPPQDRLPELIPPGVADADRETRVTALAVGADGGLLAAGDERGRLWLWHVSTVG